ncbi:MAG TPA: undecaprenyldiphospho-muramoylpentapeptide beta-N-acetylglucosaminyltransferase [Firmicutes bacterium]|nr:undecaprenyldiphospho-muramoylpentapeptide beta-N-acetylglucosaminyltransferase [Bacillota bacterium]
MRVLMTGGGTAGHINPALAIAAKIREERPDTEFLFVGAKGRMETRLVPAAGYRIETVDVRGFQRRLTVKNIGRNIAAAVHAVTAQGTSAKILREFCPDLAIGTGGYVSGPILRQAAKRGIPVLVHESNAFPGVTVKMLAKYAAATMIAAEDAAQYLPPEARVVVTGNPLRPEFRRLDREKARRELGLDGRPLILSVGGSLGAGRINDAMAEVLARSRKEGRFQHIHATGKAGWETTSARLRELGVPENAAGIDVREYIDDMPRCMAAADLVISRCGAMTLSELPAAGKPSILIPSPNVAENHQYHNAMALVKKGAAVCIEEKDLTAGKLWEEIAKIASSPETLRRMGENARRNAILDADDRIYAVVCAVMENAGRLPDNFRPDGRT